MKSSPLLAAPLTLARLIVYASVTESLSVADLEVTQLVEPPSMSLDEESSQVDSGMNVSVGNFSTTKEWEQIVLPLLSTFEFLDNASLSQADGEAELVLLAANSTIDWDATIDKLSPSDSLTQEDTESVSSSQLDKRLICGMHVVIEASCKVMYHCNFACILGYRNFPYRTCKDFLQNGKCPRGLQGYGSLKPTEPEQDFIDAPPQDSYYNEDPWRDGSGQNPDGSTRYPSLPFDVTEGMPP